MLSTWERNSLEMIGNLRSYDKLNEESWLKAKSKK